MDTSTPPQGRRWRRKAIVIPALHGQRRPAITLSALAFITFVLTVIAGCQASQRSAPTSTPTPPPSSPSSAPPPVELPITGLIHPSGVAVDTAGNVFVTNLHIPPDSSSRVLKLPAGSNTQVELPFTGLKVPGAVAVDNVGNVYVTDGDLGKCKVLKLPAG